MGEIIDVRVLTGGFFAMVSVRRQYGRMLLQPKRARISLIKFILTIL